LRPGVAAQARPAQAVARVGSTVEPGHTVTERTDPPSHLCPGLRLPAWSGWPVLDGQGAALLAAATDGFQHYPHVFARYLYIRRP
jgi:hypothetical protein